MSLNNQKVWLDLEKHKGEWIALNENEEEIVSSNKEAKLAYDEAIQKGIKTPIMFKVPFSLTPYIGSV